MSCAVGGLARTGAEAARSSENPECIAVAKGCQCTWETTVVEMRPDYGTLGVVVIYARGVVADWVDLVVTDLALKSLLEKRVADLENELGGSALALEVARVSYGRGHAEVPGSSSFTLIRLSRHGARQLGC